MRNEHKLSSATHGVDCPLPLDDGLGKPGPRDGAAAAPDGRLEDTVCRRVRTDAVLGVFVYVCEIVLKAFQFEYFFNAQGVKPSRIKTNHDWPELHAFEWASSNVQAVIRDGHDRERMAQALCCSAVTTVTHTHCTLPIRRNAKSHSLSHSTQHKTHTTA